MQGPALPAGIVPGLHLAVYRACWASWPLALLSLLYDPLPGCIPRGECEQFAIVVAHERMIVLDTPLLCAFGVLAVCDHIVVIDGVVVGGGHRVASSASSSSSMMIFVT